MTKSYKIHDNGGSPFNVVIDKNKVKVFKMKKTRDLEIPIEYMTKPFKVFKAEKIFVGKSPKNKMTKFSDGYGKEFNGNSILLHLKDDNYVYIGYKIFRFRSLNKITKYVSPVGNNDVPYPYAIDKDKNYYLMIEDVIVNNIPKKFENDPYDYYYENRLITPDTGRIPPRQPKVPNFHDISEFFHGDEMYTLGYISRPAKDYTRTSKDLGQLSVMKTNGKKVKLNKNSYVKLMTDFGKMMGFRPFKGVKVLQKRL